LPLRKWWMDKTMNCAKTLMPWFNTFTPN
jgi:hypothetical protein